jgi:AcrR family transcriptional regulator
MASRTAPRQPTTAPLQKGRKSTQRERLVTGMVAAANRAGYAGANVSAVISQAGVSRPTFYDYFADRDDCFVATVTDVQRRLLEDVRRAVDARAPEDGVEAAIRALVGFAVAQPAPARFLMKEALAGGARALDARDEGIAEIAAIVESALARAPASRHVPDLPLATTIGAVYRLLASSLRRSERALGGMLEDLLSWTRSYERAGGDHRWRTLVPERTVAASPFLPAIPLRAPLPLAPGRPRIPEEEVAENHRQRIMFATCRVVAERGYSAATIAEITRLARVDGRVFYRLFTDKQEAFSTIHELGFQHLMALTAGAFFAGRNWPERVWEAMRAATQSVQGDPTIARVGFVEAYAVGPGAIQRVEDSRVAFSIFLQEGYRYESRRERPSRLAMEAIVTSIFEIVYHQARTSSNPEMAGLLPHMVHLCLTPFMGPEKADRFIDRKLSDGHRGAAGHGTTQPSRAPARPRARAATRTG